MDIGKVSTLKVPIVYTARINVYNLIKEALSHKISACAVSNLRIKTGLCLCGYRLKNVNSKLNV